jgi:hypothetical protein
LLIEQWWRNLSASKKGLLQQFTRMMDEITDGIGEFPRLRRMTG